MSDPFALPPEPERERNHVTVENLRCQECKQMLAIKVTTPYLFRCRRCKAMVGKDA